MAIVIKKIISEIEEKKFLIEAKHRDETIQVYMPEHRSHIETYLDKEINFEMSYDEIVYWRVIDTFNEEDSGLFKKGENTIARGKIHNFIEINDDIVIDIYIMNGAEFISILSSEIKNYIPKGEEGIELDIKGLCIYHVHY
jgi:hypothetical protein